MTKPQTTLLLGDCRDSMRAMAADSIGAIVSDPPYGLSFMGRGWDHGVPGEEFWKEALRVAKPGAYLLAFGGTRTFHRLTVAIEDAGWEIRDCIMWVYGSGFPKSHDVSKGIDKTDAKDEQAQRKLRFTAWARSTGITSRQIDEATKTNMGGHYLSAASQPAIMTREHLEACRHLLGDVPAWVEQEADIRSVESKNFALREVIGENPNGYRTHYGGSIPASQVVSITAPATEAARQWEGWGTALKPAWEPVIVARKPLSGTVAENVLRYGVGGLNIDGCRVATADTVKIHSCSPEASVSKGIYGDKAGQQEYQTEGQKLGRWPANLIHDGSGDVVGLFPNVKCGVSTPGHAPTTENAYGKYASRSLTSHGDSGSAARFFYCSKADNKDRNEGCENLPPRRHSDRPSDDLPGGDNPRNRTNNERSNFHPCVKPTDLMRYLCRLVTPPGGTVLDPFMGSGSTGKAAVLEGLNFVGCELDPDYLEIARARIAFAGGEEPETVDVPDVPQEEPRQLSLFGGKR